MIARARAPPAMITILDGPVGTELASRGIPTPEPLWSALALDRAPEVVAAIHRDYAAAGATVHTANTFRTKRRSAPDRWEALARRAVVIARGAVLPGQRVAGSVSPLEDCYRPDLSPPDPRPEHRELCRVLADAGVDLMLCETFPHVGEALVAVEEAVATGIETWVAFTAGPEANLLTPVEIEEGAREAIRRGAAAVLVNCTPAARTLEYVERIAGLGVPFGAYANAGALDEGIGWGKAAEGPLLYAQYAEAWVRAGATLIGGCCGTGPAHVQALGRLAAG
ncbi:homocysteine S-methyltransferase family protein [Polyangium aurulentum]|nr:homocysteine S-methyltransferase family protein [Polyangium aurulentum]